MNVHIFRSVCPVFYTTMNVHIFRWVCPVFYTTMYTYLGQFFFCALRPHLGLHRPRRFLLPVFQRISFIALQWGSCLVWTFPGPFLICQLWQSIDQTIALQRVLESQTALIGLLCRHTPLCTLELVFSPLRQIPVFKMSRSEAFKGVGPGVRLTEACR